MRCRVGLKTTTSGGLPRRPLLSGAHIDAPAPLMSEGLERRMQLLQSCNSPSRRWRSRRPSTSIRELSFTFFRLARRQQEHRSAFLHDQPNSPTTLGLAPSALALAPKHNGLSLSQHRKAQREFGPNKESSHTSSLPKRITYRLQLHAHHSSHPLLFVFSRYALPWI